MERIHDRIYELKWLIKDATSERERRERLARDVLKQQELEIHERRNELMLARRQVAAVEKETDVIRKKLHKYKGVDLKISENFRIAVRGVKKISGKN